jgi:hypothetical protein
MTYQPPSKEHLAALAEQRAERRRQGARYHIAFSKAAAPTAVARTADPRGPESTSWASYTTRRRGPQFLLATNGELQTRYR